MRRIGGEYRREDRFVRSFRNLDGQRLWQINLRRVDRGGQDRVSVVDRPVRALHRPCICIRVPFDALDLDAEPVRDFLTSSLTQDVLT